MGDEPVSDEELALCASILKRVDHTRLLDERYDALLESGRTLFKRQILKDRFGEGDALDFLAEMHGHKLVLKKLEALQKEIDLAHASRVDEALSCKINQQRESSMLQIQSACADGEAPGQLLLGAGPGGTATAPRAAMLTDGKTFKYACLGDDCNELFEVWEPCLRHMEVCAAYLARASRPDAPTCGTNRKMQPSHQLSGAKATKLIKAIRTRGEVKSWLFHPDVCPFHGTHPTMECPKVTGRHFKTGEETGLDFRTVLAPEDCRAIYELCNGRHYTDLAVLGAAEEWQRTWSKRLAEAEEAEAEADAACQDEPDAEAEPVVEELSMQVHGQPGASSGSGAGPVAQDFRAADLPTREERRLREAARASGGDTSPGPESAARIPKGSFRRSCNTCNRSYSAVHSFYHQLCSPCGDFNMTKRDQTADLSGYVAIVTGGRVRIGYEIVLKLLRAGATVLATSRYPQDMALRFSREKDFTDWKDRLEAFGPLELADVPAIEAFCEAVARRWPRIHILVNNAAQTLTRRTGWAARMAQLEYDAALKISPEGRETLLQLPDVQFTPALLPLALVGPGGPDQTDADPDPDAAAAKAARQLYAQARLPDDVEDVPLPRRSSETTATTSSPCSSSGAGTTTYTSTSIRAASSSAASGHGTLAIPSDLTIDLERFPAGVLDESRQPLDLSRENSWRQRLGEVSTGEMMHTLAANAVAPFVLCSRLLPMLAPADGDEPNPTWGHIINVSALEGKFSVGKKSSGHPHTNMAKAALNMLTCTSASVYKQRKVLMNAVDTGWVTDNAPGGLGPKAKKHETHVGPPLDEVDGAARVLDPIFMHVNTDKAWREVGLFWRNYKVSTW